MRGGAQAAGRGTGRVLPAWMTTQGSGNGPAGTAAAPGAGNVQGQFDDAEQGGKAKGSTKQQRQRERQRAAAGAKRKNKNKNNDNKKK